MADQRQHDRRDLEHAPERPVVGRRDRRQARAWLPLLAGLVLVATCTDDQSVTGVPRGWVTPLGSLSANPPVVFVGAGDIADCNDNHDEETAALLDGIEGTVFTAGDNAYERGSDTEFQECYQPSWGRHKARTHPSVGNRDYDTQGASGYYNYFGAAAGERGKGYYSYDLGDWHIVALNNYVSMSSGSAQDTWLRADLAATTKPCKLAYYHEPLYSSINGSGSGGTSATAVRPLFTALYDAGVDFVLNGHRHFYERLAPMNPNGKLDTERGIRQFVVGTGGASIGDPTNRHPLSEVRFGSGNYGVLKLYLYSDSYAWRFVPVPGRTLSDTGSAVCHGVGTSGVSASLSTVSVAPAALEAGGAAATITVTVKDTSGTPVSGATVVLAATGSGNTLTQPASQTDANGVATGTLSATVAETKTISARANSTALTQTAQVTVTPGPLSAEGSTVTASPSFVPPGTGTATIKVTAKDAHGNPISGVTVVLAATGDGNTLTQPAGPTDANGVATGALSSTVAGTKTVSATANGTALTRIAQVTVAAGVSSTITQSLLTAGADPLNLRVYTTAAIAPAPNALITVAVLGQNSQNTPPVPTLSGGGMTAWTEVASVTFDTGTLPLRRLTIFRALSAAPGSGPITITSSMTLSHCQWIVSQWEGVETSGVNGAGAIVQTGSSWGDAVNELAVSLAAFGNLNNVAYGAFGVQGSGAVVTPGAGFTEIAEQPSGESTPGDLQVEWAPDRNTIGATWSALNAGALGVEIKAAVSPQGPVSAAHSTVVAAPSAIEAGSGTSTITVTVKDANGNPISGATVVLAATGSGNTLAQPASPTDANGVATGSVRSTVAGTTTVSATANGTALSQTAQVTVTPGPVSASASAVSAAPSAIEAGSGTATITVTAKDAHGNPISGATVVLAATGSGNTLTQPGGPTDANGVATGGLSSTVAGAKTVSATVNGTALAQTAQVTVTASVTVAITHTLLAAGTSRLNQQVYTTAVIAPAPNNLITVALLVSSSSAPPSVTLSGGGMTGWTEVASILFDQVTTPHKRLTIFRAMSATPGSGPLTITFSVAALNCQWIVSQWAGVETSGTNGAGAVGQIGSNRGDAVPGLTVPLAAFGNSNDAAYGVFGVRSQVLAVTPGAGFTEISEQPSGESPGSALQAEWKAHDNMIGATWTSRNGGALGLEIKVPGVSASHSTVTASSNSIAAGSGTATIVVTVKNADGTPISGATVVLSATGSGNTLTQPVGPTDANGVATGTLSSTVAGAKAVSAAANGVMLAQTAEVTVTPGPVSASASTVAAAPASIEAGGQTSTITVTAKDAHDNPISGATVVLAAMGSGNSLTQPAGPTDAGGVATGTLWSTVAEPKTVSATINGTAVTQTAAVTVRPGPVSATQSTLAASPTTIAPGAGASTVTVTARDANGNPISGATVVLAATGTGNTLTQPTGPTDVNGVATGTLSSTVEGTKSVSATANGTALTQTATVVVQSAVPVTHALLTVGTDPLNQRVYTTAAIAPAPNTLITVAVLGQNSQNTPPSPTLSGGGMTAWTEVASVTFDTDTLPLRRLTIFRALSAAPGSGPITITSGMTLSHCQWIVSQWDGVETSGVNGAGAIGQTGSSRGNAVTGLTVPLAAFGSAKNVAYGAFGVRSGAAAVTPGGGFTEIAEQPSGEGTPGDLQAEWATNRSTISATWATLNAGALGVEIKARTTAP